MAESTPFLGLVKPLGTENYSVSIVNSNSTTIDTFASNTDARLDAIEADDLVGGPRIELDRDTAYALNNDIDQTFDWNNEIMDTFGMHLNTAGNQHKINFLKAGLWLIVANIKVSGLSSGSDLRVRLKYNGTTDGPSNTAGSIQATGSCQVTDIYLAAINDYVVVECRQDSAASVDYIIGDLGTRFKAIWLRPA